MAIKRVQKFITQKTPSLSAAGLRDETLSKQLGYWKKQLEGVSELLQLPTDYPRPKELSYQGGIYHHTISGDLLKKIKSLGEERECTLFMTLLAVFKVLLHRYTGEEDLVVGSPIANRHYPGVENIIGFFVNTLALRTNCSDNPTFETFLSRVRGVTLEGYEHQDVPFEQLVDVLKINRSLSHHPIFQIMFDFENVAEQPQLDLDKLEGSYTELLSPVAKFDLTMTVRERSHGLACEFEYSTDLFEEATIVRFGKHFEKLIEGIVEVPSAKIGDLPLLTEEERHQILVEWNDTTVPYPDDKCIHELFEEQVLKNPEGIAVSYEDDSLTYSELNERANQLAHYLRGLGVSPECLVALSLERSIDLMVSLLGILKAGGAYVPLDPTYPVERLQFMLEDTKAATLVTHSTVLLRQGSVSSTTR